MRHVLAALALFMILPSTALAEVASASPSAFTSRAEGEAAATPDEAWRAVTRVRNWWSPAHTYSGDARALSLDPRAGGCFCERWGRDQSVEHARVVMAAELDGVRTLRIQGGLGPLQSMGAAGTLTFTIAPHAAGAKVTMTYQVTGDSSLGLDQLAPLVDQVLMQQFARLMRYAETGAPD